MVESWSQNHHRHRRHSAAVSGGQRAEMSGSIYSRSNLAQNGGCAARHPRPRQQDLHLVDTDWRARIRQAVRRVKKVA